MQAAYEEFGCNQSNVFFMGIDKGNDNAAVLAFDSIYGVHYPSVSGMEGGGNAVHWNYSVQSTPSIVVIQPDRLIAVKNVFPPDYENVVDSISQTGGIMMECTTGVENKSEKEQFLVYPTPANNKIFIATENAESGNYQLIIFDVSGREVYSSFPASVSGSKFIVGDLRGLQEGIYFLQVSTDGNPLFMQKIIIARN